MANHLVDDYETLGRKLIASVAALADPEARASGSDCAAIVRERRSIGQGSSSSFAADMRRDFELLGEALEWSGGASAAAVVRERRQVAALLEALEAPEEVPHVDELASFRRARAAAFGAPRRRRKSG